jgi:hypothetical protein
VASEPSRQDTIEHVDSESDSLDDAHWVADPHQIPGSVSRQHLSDRCKGRKHLRPGLANGETADAVTIEANLEGAFSALGAHVNINTALNDAELRLLRTGFTRWSMCCFRTTRPQN